MAEEQGGEVQIVRPFVIPRVDLPVYPGEPTRSDPTKSWRYLYNFRPHDGMLKRGYGFRITHPSSALPTLTDGIGSVSGVPVGPQWWSYFPQSDTLDSSASDNVVQGGLHVYLTLSDIIINNIQTGGWIIVTPTYTTGTVSATNGLTAINGAGGTLWVTNRVGYASRSTILIDGVWYGVTITGETTATLDTPFLGATAAGKAYTMRRWIGLCPGLIRFFNGDLYVATGLQTSSVQGGPCIIRVNDVLDPGATTTEYLGGRFGLGGAVTDPVASLRAITGLELLQDGRVALTTIENDGGERNQRFRWSSHLDMKVWTVDPGGFTDIAGPPGSLAGMTQRRGELYLFLNGAIESGFPTGQDTPPMNFKLSEANSSPYVLATAAMAGSDGGALYYYDPQYRVRRFNGQTDETVSDTPWRLVSSPTADVSVETPPSTGSFITQLYDKRREEIVFSSGGVRSASFGVNPSSGTTWLLPGPPTGATAMLVTAESVPNVVSTNGRANTPWNEDCLGGVALIHNVLRLMTLSDAHIESDPPYTLGGYITDLGGGKKYLAFAESHDMDFGLPGVDKVIDRVQVWYSKAAMGPDAVFLDGTNDFVSVGTNTVFNFTAGAFTIEAWIRVSSLAAPRMIAEHGAVLADGYRFYVETNGAITFVTSQAGVSQSSNSAAGQVTTNTWVHVAVVRNGASARIYKNGVDVTNIAGAHVNPLGNAARSLNIGADSSGTTNFAGHIKEVRIWGTNRSAGEILANYDKQVSRTSTNLLGYWTMVSGTAGLAWDMTTTLAHGTLTNGAILVNIAPPFFPIEELAVSLSPSNFSPQAGSGTVVFYQTTTAPRTDEEYLALFFPAPAASEKWRLRIGGCLPLASDAMRSRIHRIVIYYRPIGNVEAVTT